MTLEYRDQSQGAPSTTECTTETASTSVGNLFTNCYHTKRIGLKKLHV